MSCTVCGTRMKGRRAGPRQPYRYTFSGLPNVLLYGITVYRCPSCNAESPEIPKAGELHRVMADAVSRKSGRLSGEEIRFLRKNIGVSATEFAKAAGIAAETLSRAENNKGSIPIPAEQILRVMARDAARSETAREQIRELAGLALAEAGRAYAGTAQSNPCRFRLVKGKGWKQAA